MAAINAVIFDKHFTILSAGLRTVMAELADVVCVVNYDEDGFVSNLKRTGTQIAFSVVKEAAELDEPIYARIRTQHQNVRLVIAAPRVNRDVVVAAIRCGSKGLIAGDTRVQELREAIYTVSGGHEYFSTSITGLLVGEYVETIRGSGAPPAGIDMLSRREIEILTMWADGKTNAEIADVLFISVRTVESHKNHIMQKLDMRTTVDLLKFAIRSNLAKV